MQHSHMNSSQQQCEAGPLMSRFTDEGAEAWDTDKWARTQGSKWWS